MVLESKRTRRGPLSLALCAALGLSGPAGATGIPVVDVAHIAQTVLVYQQHVQELKQLVEQVKTAKSQLDEAKKTLTSITGGRGMSNLVSMTGLRQAVPPGFMETANSIRSLGAAGASKDAKAIYASIKRFGCDERFAGTSAQATDMRRLCEVDAYAAPTSLSLVQASVKSSEQRSAKLLQLLGSIDTGDAKAAMDMQNRIAIETALLTNEKMMMDMALQSQNLQRQLLDQQFKEESSKRLFGGARTGTNPFQVTSK
jgi:type IV secretion system protein VirB5